MAISLAEFHKMTDAQKAEAYAALAASKVTRVTFKVSDKGAVSAYGLGRFPVTLYAGQWERLAPLMPDVLAFITANADKVTRK